MKSYRSMMVVVSLGVLLMVSSVYAGPRGMGFGSGMCPGGGMGQWAATLDLTPEQQKQAQALRIEFMKKQEELRSQIAKKRIELLETTTSGAADEPTIEKKKQEMWALQDAARNERRAMGTKFRAILTPEQRQKLGPFGPGMGGGCLGQGAGQGFGKRHGQAGRRGASADL
jgi:Spy/CpxP family protein refolding chaperone